MSASGGGENNMSDNKLKSLSSSPLTWKQAALFIGESLASVGPHGYYDLGPNDWTVWAHKQISSLTERVKELEGTIMTLNTKLDARHEIVKELEAQLKDDQWVTLKHIMENEISALQSQLDAANKRNEELEKITQHWVHIESFHKLRMKNESLTRQLDKQGDVVKWARKVVEHYGIVHMPDTGFPMTGGQYLLDKLNEALQSAAEIREGKQ